MKKFLYFFLALFTMVSCASNEEVLPDMTAESRSIISAPVAKDNFSSFDFYGKFHNALLNYAYENFSEPEVISPVQDERLDLFVSTQAAWINEFPLSDNNRVEMATALKKYRAYLVADNLLETFNVGQPRTLQFTSEDDMLSFDVIDCCKSLYANGFIDEYENDALARLYKYIKKNADGELSGPELEANVDSLISEWKGKYADVDYACVRVVANVEGTRYLDIPKVSIQNIPFGSISGLVLNISKYSLSYWNGSNSPAKMERIAPWIAADAYGALRGAAGGIMMGILLDGEVNWGDVGLHALGGAIQGSTGVLFLKWIRN